MNETYTYIAGVIPAIILPLATFMQLQKIIRSKSVEGVSLMTWVLFGFANIGLYIFTEKYWAWQSIVGLLGTAVLNFIIVGLVLLYRRRSFS